VTSWTRCLSGKTLDTAADYAILSQWALTNVKQDCAIKLLIHNVVLEDLIVEGLRATFSSRHCVIQGSAEVLSVLTVGEDEGSDANRS
jgi:hypothetical protein